jgi:hypothetical protein
MRESLIVEQYITGLGNQEVKKHVQFAHPNTLDRAISLAVEFEAFEGNCNILRKPKENVCPTVISLTTDKGNEKGSRKVDTDVSRLDRLEESLKKVQESLKQLCYKHDKSRQLENNKQEIKSCYPDKSKGFTCFYCKAE